MKILVTGSAGFIGFSFCKYLLENKKISSKNKVELFIDGSADLQSKTAGIGGVIFVNQEKFKFLRQT